MIGMQTMFQIPLHRINIGDYQVDFENLLDKHELEVGGYSTRANVHKLDLGDLETKVLQHADCYWQEYGLDTWYEPEVHSSWANRHYRGNETLVHNHSGAPIVAVYYKSVPPYSGRLFFENPLEYHMTHEPRVKPVIHTVDVQSGDLVIFPGFMKHGTEVSQSDLPRDIISFNFAKVNRKPKEILYK